MSNDTRIAPEVQQEALDPEETATIALCRSSLCELESTDLQHAKTLQFLRTYRFGPRSLRHVVASSRNLQQLEIVGATKLSMGTQVISHNIQSLTLTNCRMDQSTEFLRGFLDGAQLPFALAIEGVRETNGGGDRRAFYHAVFGSKASKLSELKLSGNVLSKVKNDHLPDVQAKSNNVASLSLGGKGTACCGVYTILADYWLATSTQPVSLEIINPFGYFDRVALVKSVQRFLLGNVQSLCIRGGHYLMSMPGRDSVEAEEEIKALIGLCLNHPTLTSLHLSHSTDALGGHVAGPLPPPYMMTVIDELSEGSGRNLEKLFLGPGQIPMGLEPGSFHIWNFASWDHVQEKLLEVAKKKKLGHVAHATHRGLLGQLVYNWVHQRNLPVPAAAPERGSDGTTIEDTIELIQNIPSLVARAPNKIEDSSLVELSVCYEILMKTPHVWFKTEHPTEKKEKDDLPPVRKRKRSDLDAVTVDGDCNRRGAHVDVHHCTSQNPKEATRRKTKKGRPPVAA